ncbi:MAG: hypothetical protein WB630_07300 [Candidatus Acidiferrales bacterium]
MVEWTLWHFSCDTRQNNRRAPTASNDAASESSSREPLGERQATERRLGMACANSQRALRILQHQEAALKGYINMSARYVHPSHDAVFAAVNRMGGHKIGHTEEQADISEDPKTSYQYELSRLNGRGVEI